MRNPTFVAVLFLFLFSPSCKKEKTSSPSLISKHAKRLAKDWTWSRYFYQKLNDRDATEYTDADTVMPIIVHSDNTIYFMGSVYEYYIGGGGYEIYVDSTQKLVYINRAAEFRHTVAVEYYYHDDSVVYTDRSQSLGGLTRITYCAGK